MADKPTTQITPCLDYLRAERDQLQAEIDAAPSWGAAVSVKLERVNKLNQILWRADND